MSKRDIQANRLFSAYKANGRRIPGMMILENDEALSIPEWVGLLHPVEDLTNGGTCQVYRVHHTLYGARMARKHWRVNG